MKTHYRHIVALIIISISSPLRGDNDHTSISWHSIGDNVKIIGKTGVPLGEIIKISGTVIDGSTTGLKAYSSSKLLKVYKVNGIELDTPQIIEYDVFMSTIKNPDVNFEFQVKGYETGCFTGTPRGLNSLVMIASTGYFFSTSFTITEIISLKESAEPTR